MKQQFDRRALVAIAVSVMSVSSVSSVIAQQLLLPMDDGQQNHLKAYGLTYTALKAGMKAEWLLNYRAGSFLPTLSAC